MSKSQLRAVDNQQLHPLDTTHQTEWRSNAEREQLPVVNVVDSGKPLLRVDEVLNYDDHNRRLGRR